MKIMGNLIMKNTTSILKVQLQKLSMSVLLVTSMLFSSAVLAIDIARSPLFLGKGIPPNVLFVLDDSGSMDWEILTVPHFEAWNYDRDLNRSWASGGWLTASSSNKNRSEVKDGSWTSYAGYCNDKNADGICYNEQDYDDDDQKTGEHGPNDVYGPDTAGACSSCTAIWNSPYDKIEKKRHLYYWGKCKLKPVNVTDAKEYLPAPIKSASLEKRVVLPNSRTVETTIPAHTKKPFGLDDWLALVTASSDANAITGYYGCGTNAGSPIPIACADGANNNRGDVTQWLDDAANNKKYKYQDEKGGTGAWVNNVTKVVWDGIKSSCQGDTDYNWTDGTDWYAGALTGTTIPVADSVTINDHYDANTPGAFIRTAPALDINGNNAHNNGGFHEKDTVGKDRINFHYLNEFKDNVFRNTSGGPWNGGGATWRACSQGDQTYNSAYRCNHLVNADYEINYPFKSSVPDPATTQYHNGNQAILTLPSAPTQQNRNHALQTYKWDQLESVVNSFASVSWDSWAGMGPKPSSYPPNIPNGGPSPAGTHHAMGEFDPWPLIVDWRPRSSDFNVIYYNPESVYEPWPSPAVGPNHLADADFTAVHSNPQPGTTGHDADVFEEFGTTNKVPTINLAKPHGANGISEGGFIYEIWHDDAGFWDSKPEWNSSSNCGNGSVGWSATSVGSAFVAGTLNNSGNGKGVRDPATGHVVTHGEKVCSKYKDMPNGMVDLWDKHDRVEVYLNKIVVKTVRRTPHIMGEKYTSTNGGKYALMSDTRILSTVTYDNANYAATSTDAFCRATLGDDPDNPGHCRTLAQVQQNVANWFEYSRRRSFVAKGAIAKVIEKLPNLRYGLNVTAATGDVSNLFVDIPAAGPYDAHNEALTQSLYNFAWQQSTTPLRQALQRAGKYFKGEIAGHTTPIIESCQKNFAVLLTDGYWNGFNPTNTGDQDGDTFINTLADVAKKYYDEDLSTLTDDVPTNTFDTNNKQHMTTIGVAFGVVGNLTADASGAWPALALDVSGGLDGSNWGNPIPDANLPEKIDDLWHAAYNSRGSYLNAKTPKELVDKLITVISNVDAEAGSASALSVNSTVLTSDTRVYQTLFTSGEWSGDVKSYSIAASGLINPTPEWSAQNELDGVAAGARKIFTLGVANDGIPFRWNDLVDASAATVAVPDQQIALRKIWPSKAVQSIQFGKDQLNYVRGQDKAGTFRDRAHKLGDIVHSEPLYVGTPNQLYTDPGYLAFKTSQQALNAGLGRAPMLYVGANDGMLHAFDAADGSEKYAYIPRVLIPTLNSLSHLETTTQAFSHEYFVDDAPTSGDVEFTDGSWHTVIVGGLGRGGRGIYALDVTTIPLDAEASADDLALWEFTDADDADMGYSFSKPSIVRLNNGKFAAIFGNGYSDGVIVSNEKAVLYIVEFDTATSFGTVHKFETAVGDSANSNGMSTPTVIDVDGDMKADRIYAGDLLGNVWSIDISDSDPANWKFSYNSQLQSDDPLVVKTPLFTAINDDGDVQAITAPIVVSEHPLGPLAGYILNFGTGKYLGSSDNSSSGQPDQTMYGLWDYGTAGITRADLLKQEVLADLVHTASQTAVRVTTANGPVIWMNAGHSVGEAAWQGHVYQKGWRMDLVNIAGGNTDNEGERVISGMVVRGGAIILATLLPSGDPCDGGGSGWLMTLNAATGARFNESPFDINGDGLFTNDDFADLDSNGSADTAVSGVKSSSGIPSIPVMLSVPGGGTVAISDHSSGSLAFDDGLTTAGTASCTVVGTGSCTVVPPIIAGGPATCTVTDPGASCYIGGHCSGGSCLGFNFSDTGRQSWMQLE
jgi:type IV pilus assembly protein PilY1